MENNNGGQAVKSNKRAGKRTTTRALTIKILWSSTVLAAVLSAVAGAAVFLFAMPQTPGGGNPALLYPAYALSWLGALALLAIAILSMPFSSEDDEWDAGLEQLHPFWRPVIKIGAWIGLGLLLVAHIAAALGSDGGGILPGRPRFTMSLLAILGAAGALLAGSALGLPATIALLAAWGLSLVLFLVRGIVGLFVE
ncbi:hypothetical protein CVV67_15300 [Arthrobacter stackebrandtii]|nr:hypothetical protein CVV67_15300 [Arthrobacter stackebrandtii]